MTFDHATFVVTHFRNGRKSVLTLRDAMGYAIKQFEGPQAVIFSHRKWVRKKLVRSDRFS
jgi:hypothetical protein